MRLAIVALISLVLAGGCKCSDKQPAKQPPAPEVQRERQKPPPQPNLEVPEVTGGGVVPAVGLGPKITFSKTELKVDDVVVANVGADGWIDSSRVPALIRVLEGKANSDAPVAILLDATIPYRRFGQLLDVLKRAGFRNFGLLTGSGQMIPIEIPDAKELNGPGLRPVVSLERGDVTLWSASGLEGTKAKPKLTFGLGSAGFAPLTRALAEIVRNRWPVAKRTPEDLAIIIQADGNQPAQTLLQLFAAVRTDGSVELFPNIFLAGAP